MTITVGRTALLALGLSAVLFAAPVASAQQSNGRSEVRTGIEGAQILTQGRGRVGRRGGGPRRGGGSRRGHSGAYIAGGAAAAIIGGIIVNEAIRSSQPRYYYEEGLTCGQLEYRCDRGADWACRRLDEDPNC